MRSEKSVTMKRRDSASLEVGATWNFGREIEKELAKFAPKLRLPQTRLKYSATSACRGVRTQITSVVSRTCIATD